MIELLRPWAFLLLPVPWLAWRLLPALPARAAVAVPCRVCALLRRLARAGEGGRARWPGAAWLRWLGWFALVTALAGPHSLGAALLQPTGRDLIVALDLSASMAEQDMTRGAARVERYAVVRDLLGAFVARRKGDRIALIAFAQDAYLIAPLTFDGGAVAGLLDELEIGLPGRKTDLGRAIALTIRTLEDQPRGERVLILLSDGESNAGPLSPQAAARLAADRGLVIHSIGFTASADEEGLALLRDVAEATGGRFFQASTAAGLAGVTAEIDRVEPTAVESDPARLRRDWAGLALMAALLALVGTTLMERRQWSA